MNDYIAGLLIRERLRDDLRAADAAAMVRRVGGGTTRHRAAAALRRVADRLEVGSTSAL